MIIRRAPLFLGIVIGCLTGSPRAVEVERMVYPQGGGWADRPAVVRD